MSATVNSNSRAPETSAIEGTEGATNLATTEPHLPCAVPNQVVTAALITIAAESVQVNTSIPTLSSDPRDHRAAKFAVEFAGTVGFLAQRWTTFMAEYKDLLAQVRRDFWEKTPTETILGCRTWEQYCKNVLHYSAGYIRRLIQGQNPASEKHNGSDHRKPSPPPVTEAELAEYEASHHKDVRKSATNMLAQGMTPTDVIGALIGMNIPKPIAEATVRFVAEPQPAPEPEKPSSQTAELRERFTARYTAFKLSPSENNEYTLTLFNLPPALVDAIGNLLASRGSK